MLDYSLTTSQPSNKRSQARTTANKQTDAVCLCEWKSTQRKTKGKIPGVSVSSFVFVVSGASWGENPGGRGITFICDPGSYVTKPTVQNTQRLVTQRSTGHAWGDGLTLVSLALVGKVFAGFWCRVNRSVSFAVELTSMPQNDSSPDAGSSDNMLAHPAGGGNTPAIEKQQTTRSTSKLIILENTRKGVKWYNCDLLCSIWIRTEDR